MRGEEKREGFPRKPATLESRLKAPRGGRNDSGEARRVSAVAGTSQKPSQRPPGKPKRLRRSEKAPEKREDFPRKPVTLKSRPNGSRAEAGTFPKPPKRLRRSAKTISGSRHLPKAASASPGATQTAPEKREDYQR